MESKPTIQELMTEIKKYNADMNFAVENPKSANMLNPTYPSVKSLRKGSSRVKFPLKVHESSNSWEFGVKSSCEGFSGGKIPSDGFNFYPFYKC